MIKDTMIYMIGKVIPALVMLAMIILVVRVLGEAEYGKYSMVFYATMLVSTLTFGWIQQSMLRFLTAYPEKTDKTINRFFHLTIFSSVLAVLFMIPLCVFYFQLTWLETGVVLAYVFLYNFYWFNLTLNQAQTKPVRFALLESSYYLIYIGVLIVFLFVLKMKWFAVLFLSMTVGLVFAELIRFSMPLSRRYDLNLIHFYWDREFTKKMLDFGFTLTFWLFISYVVTIADRFIIKEFYSYTEVGIYSAVKDLIIKIATFATAPVILAYHPWIVREWNEGKKERASFLIRESIQFILIEMVIISIVFLFLQDFLYNYVLHLTSHVSRLLSALILGSAFLWQLAMMIHKPLELLLRQKHMLWIIISVMLSNIVANLLFVPVYGIIAAAFTAFGSSLLYIIIVIMLILRDRWVNKGKS